MTNHFNGLTESQAERLALVMEEMGEALHVIGKILRHGYESRYLTKEGHLSNREWLTVELGDVVLAVSLLVANDDIPETGIHTRVESKLGRVFKYMHHQEEFTFTRVL